MILSFLPDSIPHNQTLNSFSHKDDDATLLRLVVLGSVRFGGSFVRPVCCYVCECAFLDLVRGVPPQTAPTRTTPVETQTGLERWSQTSVEYHETEKTLSFFLSLWCVMVVVCDGGGCEIVE